MIEKFKYIGAAIGNCNNKWGCELAPEIIKTKLKLHANWHKTIYAENINTKLEAFEDLAEFSRKLARETYKLSITDNKFFTIGGDHSCGIGTWSGVHEAIGDFGLIWVDAHLDSHTLESSPSKNLHGIPVASLLGEGDNKLSSILNNSPKIKPENLVFVGTRSYEYEEIELLKRQGVKIYFIEEVIKRGFSKIMNDIIANFEAKNLKYGISFDLDVLSPQEFPAVGTPVKNGITSFEVIDYFNNLKIKNLIGFELVEYNPNLDTNYNALDFICELNNALNKEPNYIYNKIAI
jgi:arginase